MSYNQRYNLSQVLRDGTTLSVKIYDKDYSGSNIIDYEATNIRLQSNASGDEPTAGIISSQLNISFIVTEDDGANFPSLLTFDDRKYFVKLYKDSTLLWAGFLFNDYVQAPFTTGWIEVSLIAIDGLSLLQYPVYNYITDTYSTSLISLLQVICNSLNLINFPEPLILFTSCSYYAQGMSNRSTALQNEPFSQSNIYVRDLNGNTYYNVLDSVVKSLGCRMFQSDGKWQIISINEMADTTRYFTEYTTYPTPTYYSAGTINNIQNIQPYELGNLHFIDNSQTKIVRKGYPKLVVNHSFNYASNYLHNGGFKGFIPYTTLTSTTIYGWYLFSSTGLFDSDTFNIDDESDFNNINLRTPTTGADRQMWISNVVSPTSTAQTYCPVMSSPSFNFSFEYYAILGFTHFTSLEIKMVFLGTNYYYNIGANQWQTSQMYNTIDVTAGADVFFATWKTYSTTIGMQYPTTIQGSGFTYWEAPIFVKIKTSQAEGYTRVQLRNIKIVQNGGDVNSLNVTRLIGTEKNVFEKDITQDYGVFTTLPEDIDNLFPIPSIGVLYNTSRQYLKNWYRYPNTTTLYLQLQQLIARQYSNLLNRNFGTLEGDLGKFNTTDGMVYLDKVYTIEDSSTNVLSYNNKKFMMNRGDINARVDEVNSVQLIEITDTDNASVETVKYISS